MKKSSAISAKTSFLALLAIGILSGPGFLPSARATSISTIFTGGNGNSVGGGNYFDANVNSGITITGLSVATMAVAGTAINLEVWTRAGTAFGFEGTSAGWTLAAMGTGISAGPGGVGPNSPSSITLSGTFALGAGVTGIAIKNVDYGASYTNGDGSNQSYANGDLTLSLGKANNTFFTLPNFSPRVWNGTIEYTATATTPAVPDHGASSAVLLALGLVAMGGVARRVIPLGA